MPPSDRQWRWIERLVPPLFEWYMRLVWFTCRVRWIGFDPFWGRQQQNENLVAALPHQNALIGAWIWRHKRGVMMVSHSRDGQLIGKGLSRLGYHLVHGSSSKGGREALDELIEYQQTVKGRLFGLAIDGPKGPPYKSKAGVIKLARVSGDPLFPVYVWTTRAFFAHSWDKTIIPKPFGRVFILCGMPQWVARDATPEQLEDARLELDRRILRLVVLARELCAHPERADACEADWAAAVEPRQTDHAEP